jgi:mRNA interferase MazF
VAPWQVWWVRFHPQVGHEQGGLRPAVVVGSPAACALRNDLAMVVPCTSRNRGLAFHPPVTLAGREGVAMCDQLRAVSMRRLVSRHEVGALPTEQRGRIAEVLRYLLVD